MSLKKVHANTSVVAKFKQAKLAYDSDYHPLSTGYWHLSSITEDANTARSNDLPVLSNGRSVCSACYSCNLQCKVIHCQCRSKCSDMNVVGPSVTCSDWAHVDSYIQRIIPLE